MTWLLALWVAATHGQEEIIRPNHGVIFTPQHRRLVAGHSYMDLVFTIPRPSPFNQSAPRCGSIPSLALKEQCIGNCRQHLLKNAHPWCILFPQEDHEQIDTLVESILVSQAGINALLHSPLQLDTSRKERAPLSFIGDISRALFGLARVKDLKKVTGTVNDIIAHVKEQDEYVNKEMSLVHKAVDATAKTLDAIQLEVEHNSQAITGLSTSVSQIQTAVRTQDENIKAVASNLHKLSRYLANVSERRANIMSKLQTYAIALNSFLSGVTSLSHGILSPIIIPPSDLQSSLEKAEEVIAEKFPGNSLIRHDLAYYYDHHLASYQYTTEYIIVHIKAPFAQDHGIFDLFSITSFPVPLTPHDPTALGYTRLQSMPDYVALDQGRSVAIELSHAQMAMCTGKALIVCPFDHVMITRPSFTCATAVLFQQDNIFKGLCTTNVHSEVPVPNSIFPVSEGQYLVTTSEQHYQISCPTKLTSLEAHAYVHLTIPCHCSLHVASLSVTPSLTDCDPSLQVAKVLHPVNYPVFLTFGFKPHQFDSVNLSNTSLKLQVPNINGYISNFTDLSQRAKKAGLDLHKVSEAMAEVRTTYDRYEPRRLSFLPMVDDGNSMGIFIIIVIIVIVALIAAVAFLLFRTKGVKSLLSAGYMAASAAAPTASARVLSPITTSPAPRIVIPTLPTMNMTDFHYMKAAAAFLLTLVLFYLARYIVTRLMKYFRVYNMCCVTPVAQDSFCCNLILHLSNGFQQVSLFLVEIPYPEASLSNIRRPMLTDHYVFREGCPIFYSQGFQFKWSGDLLFFTDSTEIKLPLPQKVYVPIPLRRTLHNMLKAKDTYHIQDSLLIKSHNCKTSEIVSRHSCPQDNEEVTPPTAPGLSHTPTTNPADIPPPAYLGSEPLLEHTVGFIEPRDIKTDSAPSDAYKFRFVSHKTYNSSK